MTRGIKTLLSVEEFNCGEILMRESCLECVMKHVGKAAVLIHELRDYPFHFIYVIGNLSEAEDECEKDYPELRDRIYQVRKSYQRGETIDIDNLVRDLYEMWLNDRD